MSGASDQDDLAAIKQLQQLQQLLNDLKTAHTALENGDEGSYQIPPAYVCMGICDELRNLGSIAKSSVSQVQMLSKRPALNDDERLLKLRAAHAHFAITGEPGICLDVAMCLLDLVSTKRFSEDSPLGHDELFWLRSWACDVLADMGVVAASAVERLKRLADEDGCSRVRESARQAIGKIRENWPEWK